VITWTFFDFKVTCWHGHRKDFFQGGPLGDFFKIFLGVRSGKTWFFPLETKKITFFAEIFKIMRGQGPLFRRPCFLIRSSNERFQFVFRKPQSLLLPAPLKTFWLTTTVSTAYECDPSTKTWRHTQVEVCAVAVERCGFRFARQVLTTIVNLTQSTVSA